MYLLLKGETLKDYEYLTRRSMWYKSGYVYANSEIDPNMECSSKHNELSSSTGGEQHDESERLDLPRLHTEMIGRFLSL